MLIVKKIRHYAKKILITIPELAILKCSEFVCSTFPLQNKVVLDNFLGRGFGDDPKYIAQYLLKMAPDIKLIWVSNGSDSNVPEGIDVVKYKSIMYIYHLCTSRVWVDNVKNGYKPVKRTEQFYIQTWHATMSLKAVEGKALNLDPIYIKESKLDSSKIDLMYANNDFELSLYKQYFWYNGEVLKCDVPRESPIVNPTIESIAHVRQFFGLCDEVSIVLYAPTFRKNENLSVYKWNYEKVLDAFRKKFKKKYVLLLRLHPSLLRYSNKFCYSDKVLNGSSYPDMQDLIGASDILINDYSSSMFEFGFAKKKVFLYAPDHKEYCSTDRGLEFNLLDLPFPLSESEDELVDTILDFDQDSYLHNLNDFHNLIGLKEGGFGDKVIGEIIINKMKRS